MLLIWDNASWHLSQAVKNWITAHNQQVKHTHYGVRLLVCPLPTKSPWLNPIEPMWVHGKRRVVEPEAVLSPTELAERVCAMPGLSDRAAARVQATLADALVACGRPGAAHELYDKAASLARAAGDRHSEAKVAERQGILLEYEGRTQEGRARYATAAQMARMWSSSIGRQVPCRPMRLPWKPTFRPIHRPPSRRRSRRLPR